MGLVDPLAVVNIDDSDPKWNGAAYHLDDVASGSGVTAPPLSNRLVLCGVVRVIAGGEPYVRAT